MDNKGLAESCECFTRWNRKAELSPDISEIRNCLGEISLFFLLLVYLRGR